MSQAPSAECPASGVLRDHFPLTPVPLLLSLVDFRQSKRPSPSPQPSPSGRGGFSTTPRVTRYASRP